MTPGEYARCARRISASLQLEPGERVLIKLDPRMFAPLIEPLQQEIRNPERLFALRFSPKIPRLHRTGVRRTARAFQ